MVRMLRKVIGGVVGAVVLVLSGCGDPSESERGALEQWAASDPAFADLKFSPVVAGGFPSGTISVGGTVAAEDVAEFVVALVALREKGEELDQELTSHVKAQLGNTGFKWQGPFPSAEFGAEAAELLEPFAAPEVAEVSIKAAGPGGGVAVEVDREASISDAAARDFRDRAYAHLGEGAIFTLRGFPLYHPVREEGVPGWGAASPNLALRADGATLSELVAQAERVDAASSLYLYHVANGGPVSVWYFYADGAFNPDDLQPIKEILRESVDGKPANVIVSGPDGELHREMVGD